MSANVQTGGSTDDSRENGRIAGGFITRVLRSFPYAFVGVSFVLRTQTNAWVHAFATLMVFVAGATVGVSRTEWCLLILAIGLVWTAEAANTAIERLADAVHPEANPLIGQAKDVGAGAVLLASVAAAVVGLIILGPRILALGL